MFSVFTDNMQILFHKSFWKASAKILHFPQTFFFDKEIQFLCFCPIMRTLNLGGGREWWESQPIMFLQIHLLFSAFISLISRDSYHMFRRHVSLEHCLSTPIFYSNPQGQTLLWNCQKSSLKKNTESSISDAFCSSSLWENGSTFHGLTGWLVAKLNSKFWPAVCSWTCLSLHLRGKVYVPSFILLPTSKKQFLCPNEVLIFHHICFLRSLWCWLLTRLFFSSKSLERICPTSHDHRLLGGLLCERWLFRTQ